MRSVKVKALRETRTHGVHDKRRKKKLNKPDEGEDEFVKNLRENEIYTFIHSY